jgi:hypothetical protein
MDRFWMENRAGSSGNGRPSDAPEQRQANREVVTHER